MSDLYGSRSKQLLLFDPVYQLIGVFKMNNRWTFPGVYKTCQPNAFRERHEAAEYLTIIPRARMGSESIAHEAEGRMGY